MVPPQVLKLLHSNIYIYIRKCF